nr:hypothetical protein GCM10025732_37110 [Glycomyces mayteni]
MGAERGGAFGEERAFVEEQCGVQERSHVDGDEFGARGGEAVQRVLPQRPEVGVEGGQVGVERDGEAGRGRCGEGRSAGQGREAGSRSLGPVMTRRVSAARARSGAKTVRQS